MQKNWDEDILSRSGTAKAIKECDHICSVAREHCHCIIVLKRDENQLKMTMKT